MTTASYSSRVMSGARWLARLLPWQRSASALPSQRDWPLRGLGRTRDSSTMKQRRDFAMVWLENHRWGKQIAQRRSTITRTSTEKMAVDVRAPAHVRVRKGAHQHACTCEHVRAHTTAVQGLAALLTFTFSTRPPDRPTRWCVWHATSCSLWLCRRHRWRNKSRRRTS